LDVSSVADEKETELTNYPVEPDSKSVSVAKNHPEQHSRTLMNRLLGSISAQALSGACVVFCILLGFVIGISLTVE